MSKKVRIGLLSVNHPHVWTRTEVLSTMEDVELTGVWEPDADLARRFSERYGVRILDIDALLTAPDVDAVIVSIYTPHMAKYTVQALEAGKAVLVEKPAANNLANMQRIVDAAKRTGKLVQVGYMCHHSPIIDELASILKEGLLGRVTTARFHVAVPAPDATTEWFCQEEDIGGVLYEDGCHMMDLVIHLLGMPKRVSGFVPKFDDLSRHGHPWEDAAVATLEFDDVVATFDLTGWEANDWFDTWELAFFGDEGTAIAQIIPPELKVFVKTDRGRFRAGWNYYAETRFPKSWVDHEATHLWHVVQHRSFFRTELRRFIDAVKSGDNVGPVSAEQGLNVIRVLDAIYRSARESRVVTL